MLLSLLFSSVLFLTAGISKSSAACCSAELLLSALSNSAETVLFLATVSAEEAVLSRDGDVSSGPAGVLSRSVSSASAEDDVSRELTTAIMYKQAYKLIRYLLLSATIVPGKGLSGCAEHCLS